tara:strand:+ start:2793 stop:3395 length:603 start_codon:yes stop_codon:yes gene_type:complete
MKTLNDFKATKKKKDLTVKELKEICDECGIAYTSRVKEIALIGKINKYIANQPIEKTAEVDAAADENASADPVAEASKEASDEEVTPEETTEQPGPVQEPETKEAEEAETDESKGDNGEGSPRDETEEGNTPEVEADEVEEGAQQSMAEATQEVINDLLALSEKVGEKFAEQRSEKQYALSLQTSKRKIDGLARMLKRTL